MAGIPAVTCLFIIATATFIDSAAAYRYLNDAKDLELAGYMRTCSFYYDEDLLDVTNVTIKKSYYGDEYLIEGSYKMSKGFRSPVKETVVLLRPNKRDLVVHSINDYCSDMLTQKGEIDLFSSFRFSMAYVNHYKCPIYSGTDRLEYVFIKEEEMANLAEYIEEEGTLQQYLGDACIEFDIIRVKEKTIYRFIPYEEWLKEQQQQQQPEAKAAGKPPPGAAKKQRGIWQYVKDIFSRKRYG